jgi:hypothetical protein
MVKSAKRAACEVMERSTAALREKKDDAEFQQVVKRVRVLHNDSNALRHTGQQVGSEVRVVSLVPSSYRIREGDEGDSHSQHDENPFEGNPEAEDALNRQHVEEGLEGLGVAAQQ